MDETLLMHFGGIEITNHFRRSCDHPNEGTMKNTANIVNRKVGPEPNRKWNKLAHMILTASKSYGLLTE